MSDPANRPSSVREYKKATLTRSVIRHDAGDRLRHITGAAYHKGRLIPESQRVGGSMGDFVVADDPESLPADPTPPWRLHGRWLYGGHWMGQFGHFLTETLTSLWPEPDPSVDGLVFHRFIFDASVQQWQTELLLRTGWDLPVVVVNQRHPCLVDRLVIPSRIFGTNDYVAPEAVPLWDRMAGTPPACGPLFLSRTRLRDNPRRLEGDEELDILLADLGLRIVHPQELRPSEQVALAAGASVIVGVGGSQLHLSMFAPTQTQVIQIGDTRSPSSPVPNQLLIDGIRARRADFVPLIPGPAGGRDAQATARAVAELLT